ncbi:hypothetical protein R0K30_13645 [Bacillus sp. SIMBA_154]|uniref:hypothetical protein n=1 Tax=Bacillus sp. SIMBA_154 TaxID=3080859 RepID=UPI003978FBFE
MQLKQPLLDESTINKKSLPLGFFLCMVWMRNNGVMKLPMIPLSFTHQSVAYIRSPYALRFSQKRFSLIWLIAANPK